MESALYGIYALIVLYQKLNEHFPWSILHTCMYGYLNGCFVINL